MQRDITAIVGAMDSEIDLFLSLLATSSEEKWGDFTFYRGVIESKEVVIVKCGVGKVLSSMITQYLISTYEPSRVVFTGIAGALSDKLDIGDILIAKDTVQHDLDATAIGFERGQIPYTDYKIFSCDVDLCRIMKDFIPSEKHKVLNGRILTGDQFYTASDKQSHSYLMDELKGDAIEMEGASVAAVCYFNNTPCVIIRTISDKADDSAHLDFEAFLPVAARNSLDAILFLLKSI